MWCSVLLLALPVALNPLRLGFTLLLVSRPRPMQNLFAYWLGTLTSCIPAVLVPLMLLHMAPVSRSFAPGQAASSAVRHIQIGAGVFLLSIAALMTVRLLARPREQARGRAQLPIPRGNISALVLDSNMPTTFSRQPTGQATRGRRRKNGTTSTLVQDLNTPNPISRLLDRTQDAPTEGKSAIRRLLGRAHSEWENGSLWVAFAIGFVNFPAPDVAFMVLAVIVGSGAVIVMQFSAAIAFIVGILAVVEITLISYLVAPAKTRVALRLLHDWSWTHRRQILVALIAIGGLSLMANGFGAT